MFTFNISAFPHMLKLKDDAKQKAAFMLLAGFNIFSTTLIVFVLHPEMANNMPALAFSGMVGGGVLFAVSSIPFKS
jgi:hypothetical protein